MLTGQKLITRNGKEINAEEAVTGSDIVLLYFSAHWCPPCREFTPVLKQFYEEIGPSRVCIIFVSSDENEVEMTEYFTQCHGNYFAVPFGTPLAK